VNTYSNATCLWQKILWADGALDSASDIDGIFGSDTETATRLWQHIEGLPVDGVVGPATFGKTGEHLWGGDTGSTRTLTYNAYGPDLTITRNASGQYGFIDGDGNSRLAGYDCRTCS
jgi:hypothetical protein